MYCPPPLWIVNHMDRNLRDKARDASAAQAVLTVASRHGKSGDYKVAAAADRSKWRCYHVSECSGLWNAYEWSERL